MENAQQKSHFILKRGSVPIISKFRKLRQEDQVQEQPDSLSQQNETLLCFILSI